MEVSPNAVPPVCRIQDYGRFLYEKEKSERAARKKQKVITIKEVKFSVTVDEHDYQTKKNQAVRFLNDGDKVKASLRFRGRQMAHRELGYNIINRLIQDIGDAGTVEFMPRMEGTILHAILAPSKKGSSPSPNRLPRLSSSRPPRRRDRASSEQYSRGRHRGRPFLPVIRRRFPFENQRSWTAGMYAGLHEAISARLSALDLCSAGDCGLTVPRTSFISPPATICAI